MIFLFPTDMEAAKFRAAAPDAKVVICGVGMAATSAVVAELSMELPKGEMLLLAGIAGSYNAAQIAVGKVVEVVKEQIEELPSRFRMEYRVSPKFSLTAVSSNTVNRSNFIGATSQIENMEGAALFAICERLHIPCGEVRAVSNLVGEPVERWSIDEAIDALTNSLLDIYNSRS